MTTPTTVQVRLQIRADTAANWTSVNPILLANELGLETDTKKFKIGDGTTAWNSLAYFPSIVSGGTVLGNLEIGTTGTLTFEGSTADGFETTLGVVDPTADRTILLPDQSGTVVVGGNASITNADIAANAEIAVSKLANGTANQVLVTDGTDVSWSDNLTLAGDLTVNGTTTTINTETLTVKDKNIELAVVDTPTDVTADGGGITLKGTTDKTINWIDATDAWTSSERFSVPLGSASAPSLTFTGDENTGIYSPGADQLALSTNGIGRLFVDASGNVGVNVSTPSQPLHVLGAGTVARFDSSNAATLLRFSNSSNALGYIGYESSDLTFYTNDSERLRITSAGLVGIGTSSPSRTFHVSGTTDTPAQFQTSQANLYINLVNSSASNGYIGFEGTNLSLWNGGANRLNIDSSGRVGIGTSPASAKLEIAHGNELGLLTSGPYNYQAKFESTDSEAAIVIEDSNSTNDGNRIGVIGDNMAFTTANTERARIDSSGRLLVGTSTSPSAGQGQFSLAVVQGYSGGSTGAGDLSLQRGQAATSMGSGDDIGYVKFNDNAGNTFASIAALVDATPGASDFPGRLVFSTTADGASSPTERMRITNNGTFLFNATSTGPYFDTSFNVNGRWALKSSGVKNSGDGLIVADGTGSRSFVNFITGSPLGEVGSISTNGTNTAYNTSSDYRLKENITSITDGIVRLQQLKPSRFNFIAHPTTVVDGFIAHEVQAVIPEAITGEKDAVDEDGNPVYQGIDQSKLVPLLTAALQEAIERIETLEAKVAALETP